MARDFPLAALCQLGQTACSSAVLFFCCVCRSHLHSLLLRSPPPSPFLLPRLSPGQKDSKSRADFAGGADLGAEAAVNAANCVLVSFPVKADHTPDLRFGHIPTQFDDVDPELATISSGDLASSIFLVSRPCVPRDRVWLTRVLVTRVVQDAISLLPESEVFLRRFVLRDSFRLRIVLPRFRQTFRHARLS